MKTTLIAVLVAVNVALSCVLLYGAYFKPAPPSGSDEVLVDHVTRLHLNTHDGRLRATFGQQDKPDAITVTMTPRAAVGLHHELGIFLKSIDRAAKGEREAPESSDRVL